jgi:hypothetical protein
MPKVSRMKKEILRIPLRVAVPKYFVLSVDADRSIGGFGFCKRGDWVHVSKGVYDDIQNSIVDGEKSGTVVGWKTKIEYDKLEVF